MIQGRSNFRLYYGADHKDKNGNLISRSISVQPPNPPSCLSLRCLIQYFKDSLFCALLSSYHSRRVYYAEANRYKKILSRYRTGYPAPETIWQAIHANIKLKCPICRKFNTDPLLGSNKYKEINNEPDSDYYK